jgi:hypothetical protein
MIMRKIMSIALFFVVVLGIYQPCLAQELDIFQQDTFIEPIDLKTELPDGSVKARAFFASRALIGVDQNYQYRNNFTNASVGFINLNSNFYYSSFQVSWEVSGLETIEGEDVSSFKNRVKIGGYLEDTSNEPDSELYGSGRWSLFWNMEKIADNEYEHEYGVELNGEVANFESPFVGGMIYGWKPEQEEHYLAIGFRYIIKEIWNDWLVRWGWGLSGERVRQITRGGIFRNEFSLEIPLKLRTTTMNVLYSSSYHFTKHDWNHEIGVYLNIPVLAHLH